MIRPFIRCNQPATTLPLARNGSCCPSVIRHAPWTAMLVGNHSTVISPALLPAMLVYGLHSIRARVPCLRWACTLYSPALVWLIVISRPLVQEARPASLMARPDYHLVWPEGNPTSLLWADRRCRRQPRKCTKTPSIPSPGNMLIFHPLIPSSSIPLTPSPFASPQSSAPPASH